MALRLLSLLALLGFAACATQEEVDYLGRFLGVKVQVADNQINSTELTLTNMGSSMIEGGDWAIYFCSMRKVLYPTAETPDEHNFLTYGLNITHLKGCLHYLAPAMSFRAMGPGEERRVVFLSEHWSVAKTDHFPNWFAASRSGSVTPRTVMSTTGESLDFVGDFDMAKKWKRHANDRYDPLTPLMRFMNIHHMDHGAASYEHPIVPTPVKSEPDMDKMVYFNTGDWVIVADEQDQMLYGAAHFLMDKTGWPVTSDQPKIRYVKFMKGNPMVEIRGVLSESKEGYMLVVNETTQSATIMANTAPGAFYGAMSLMSLWGDNMQSKEAMIKDAPRFPYRGLLLDVARNFMSKDYVMKLLHVMGMYKLNKLHLHLANDEGWRLEIPGLPELTEIGSRRCYDPEEKECLMSQLGSGPKRQSVGREYYSVDEYREILKYASDRHIEVIPEFAMPSYARAAIISMKKRYSEYRGGNHTAALEYSLSDYDDSSVYESYSKYTDNVMNPCIESTYKFAKHVVMQVTKMHQGVNPLKTFNFLGKPEPDGAWSGSRACADLMSRMESLKNVKDLRKYFVMRMSNITAEFGLGMATWADALFDYSGKPISRSMFQNEQVTGYAWNNVWEMGKANQAYMLANYDYKVVLSHATHLYLNHPQEAHPDERGEIKAARFVDTAKIFMYTPDDVYANVDYNMCGDPMTRDALCSVTTGESPCIPLSKPQYILGMEASLWTPVVRTEEQADAMLFPRLLAFAERAWHKADWEMEADPAMRMAMMKSDWESFSNTLGYRELPRLDNMDVLYNIPQPAAKLMDGQLQTRCQIPGLKVEYSVDNGESWNTEQGVYLSGNVMFRTRSADMGRTSRTEKEMFDAVRFRSLCKNLYLP